MALPETRDSPQSLASSSSSDPQLSRNLSSTRLNAQAPEFVPTRSTVPPPQQQQQNMSVVIPPPPPPGMMHMYSPPPGPAGAAFHLPVPMPPHLVPVHHHMSVRNHQPNPYQHHHHREQEVEAVAKKDQQKEHKDHGAASSKKGLSEEATLKILNQVEYYFSDLNLATTDHLMRFINKDPEGYVPISVVASFKKIKALVTTHSKLATVLRNSSKLLVSEDGKKVKRLHPLTESDMEELQSRIIVAENLPEDHCHQNLMKIFSAVGSVKTIRTCQPQPAVSSASRSSKGDGMHFSNKLHAFVEYESVELAEKAVVELNDEGNWRSGLRVRLMLRNASKPVNARAKKGHDGEDQCEEDEVSISEMHSNEKQQEDPFQLSDFHSHGNPQGEKHPNEKEGGQKKGRNRGRGKGLGRAQYHHNNNNQGNHGGTPPPSASTNWVCNEQASVAKQQPPGPRMPDGTRGFAMGRGKPVAVNTA